MTIDATSKLMTKNAAVIFYYAASISRRRSYQSSSIVEGQFCQRDVCDGSHRIRRSITGGKDHQWRDRASLMRGLPNQISVLIASLRRYAELGSVRLLKDGLCQDNRWLGSATIGRLRRCLISPTAATAFRR